MQFICDDLGIDSLTLSKYIEIDHLEQLIAKIESNINFNGKQLKFINIISEHLDDNLLGLLNILISKSNYFIFYRCMIMEMLTYIYHYDDDIDDDDDDDENEGDKFEDKIVYEICNHLKISKNVVNEINITIKQQLEAEAKFESIFIKSTQY